MSLLPAGGWNWRIVRNSKLENIFLSDPVLGSLSEAAVLGVRLLLLKGLHTSDGGNLAVRIWDELGDTEFITDLGGSVW
jgi:hypothetical protein